jgi:chitinase
MKRHLILITTLISMLSVSCHRQSSDNGLKIMAYYFPNRRSNNTEKLNLDKLTHIIFSFTEVIGNEMKFRDDSTAFLLEKLLAEKKHYHNLKVMVACGGWAGSGGFSEMSRTPETRKKFVSSVGKFIRKYRLDGLDIDWEYPGLPGIGNPYVPEDKENFTALMKELRDELNSISKELVLTFAAAGWQNYFYHIELDKVMPSVNYMNIMTYDMAGGEDPYTSHHTNLGMVRMEDLAGTPAFEKIVEEGDSTKPFSAEKIISWCIKQGVNPSQIVIGAAFYGKGWEGVPPQNNGLYQLAKGPWRERNGYSTIREKREDKNGFARHWDPVAKAPFLYNATDSIFVSYEDTVSIRLKTEYVINRGLGGIMFWSLNSDAPEEGLVEAIFRTKMKQNH